MAAKTQRPVIRHGISTIDREPEEEKRCASMYCLICQSSGGHLLSASEHGKERIRTVLSERRKLNDTEFVSEIDRLDNIPENDWNQSNMYWHKNCYVNFTAEMKLNRLRNKRDVEIHVQRNAEAGVEVHRVSRSSRSAVDWSRCMFCQSDNVSDMRNVATMSLSDKILEFSKHDLVMHVRLANSADLIAAESKYHLKCFVEFERRHKRRLSMPQAERQDADLIMDELGDHLRVGISRGNVYDMGAVWEKYNSMCTDYGVDPLKSYVSRRKTFNDAVIKCVGTKASFIRPLDMKAPLLIYPSDKSQFAISNTLTTMADDGNDAEADSFERSMRPDTSIQQEIVHTALHIRNDLADTPGHRGAWQGIDQTNINTVIPDSLYQFLSVLFGGSDVLDTDGTVEETKRAICSIAQDIVFTASKGRKLTPKHVGLGLTLHQATRSEQLVNLFHSAGHCISIDTIRRIDTTIANNILDEYERNDFVYVPTDIVPYETGRLILSSCDNIDVLEETIDGKNTFHCTQMVTWQRGPTPNRKSNDNDIKRPKSLARERLEKLHELDHATNVTGKKQSPQFPEEFCIKPETWFNESTERNKAKLLNEAWTLSRLNDTEHSVPPWSAFNEEISEVDPPLTTIGMLPILQAPADDNDTMTTVINRFTSITKKLGQKHTVLVVDQPLYSRAKSLVWANPNMYMNVVVLLGDLHILFNFLKAIGKHLENSGLVDMWVESGLFAENSTDAMMNGKAYYRAVRGHIWAYEALNRIWWTRFEDWLNTKHVTVAASLKQCVSIVQERFSESGDNSSHAVSELVKALNDQDLQLYMKKFNSQFDTEPNNKYWQSYIEMIDILLDFIRANRDGNWKLHLDAFAAMLPWMTIYDHTNYARWGPVYLADMNGLAATAPEVHAEFLAGNFVVKRSSKRFNQIPVDQATEWMNRMCKISNGIIGITRNDTARDRFCATWAERSHVSHATKSLYGLDDTDNDKQQLSARKDDRPSPRKYDHDAVNRLTEIFHRFNVYKMVDSSTTCPEELHEMSIVEESTCTSLETGPTNAPLVSVTSNDVASNEIKTDLLSAESRGVERVIANVRERLIEKSVSFHEPLKRHGSKTFASLYKCTAVNEKNEKKVVKADRQLIQKLLTVAQAGRDVQMNEILKHKLSPAPLSLASTSGEMNSAAKSDLLGVLITANSAQMSTILPEVQEDVKTCTIVDGHALIQALGKPTGCQTFNDYAEQFIKLIARKFNNTVKRIDVVFDRYIGTDSIKSFARRKRIGKRKRPIRKMIDSGNVPLPHVWAQFIMMDENKADLAHFLSRRIIEYGPNLDDEYELITAGGFDSENIAKSTRRSSIPQLEANHEEADTRIILHSLDAISHDYLRLLVECRDTDVLVMMIHFLGHVNAGIWMVGGTAKQRKYYSVSEITRSLPATIVANLPGFHALTGTDTTSFFTGHGKKSCWKIFNKYPELINGVGRNGPLEEIEEFVCRLYGASSPVQGVNSARHALFLKGKKALEKLPPTRDALQLHLLRANYQANIWLHANVPEIDIGSPFDTGGWETGQDGAKIIWCTLPSVPASCIALVACGCTTKCKMAACKCYKSQMICTPACACDADKCCNPNGL